VFGPLLFATFIEILPKIHRISYADDLQIYFYFSPRDLEVTLKKIKKAAIECWSSRNGLTLNANKTKALLLKIFVNNSKKSHNLGLHLMVLPST